MRERRERLTLVKDALFADIEAAGRRLKEMEKSRNEQKIKTLQYMDDCITVQAQAVATAYVEEPLDLD